MLLFYSLILFVVHPPLFYQKRPVAIFSRLGSLCQPEDASAVAIMSCFFFLFLYDIVRHDVSVMSF